MFKPIEWNARFMTDPGYNDAAKYGVTVTLVQVQPGQPYWRIIGIHHLAGLENGGNHNVYADVLDEQGQRIMLARLKLTQDGAAPVFAVVDKPSHEAGTNFPLWSENLVAVQMDWPQEPLPSDKAQGIRTTHPDEPPGNTWGHHSFYVVFQRAVAGSEPGTDPDSSPGLPGWRDKFTSFEKNLIKYYVKNPNTLETELIVKLVKALDGEL